MAFYKNMIMIGPTTCLIYQIYQELGIRNTWMKKLPWQPSRQQRSKTRRGDDLKHTT